MGTDPPSTIPYPSAVNVLDGENVQFVRCFGDTSGALTESGDLYLWGDNSGKKISQDSEEPKFFPFLVDGLDGVNVVDFAIGSKHCMVLDDAGRVFTWGWGGRYNIFVIRDA